MYKTLTRALTLAITLLTALTQQGCKREMSPDELLQKCGSGVVLVLNQYYYKVTLPSCKPWYFTAINEKGEMQGLTFDKEEIEANRQMLTGNKAFKELFRALEAGETPILFHCTAKSSPTDMWHAPNSTSRTQRTLQQT